MRHKRSHRIAFFGWALLLSSSPAAASDYALLPALLYGGLGIAFAVVFTATRALTLGMSSRWLRVLALCVVTALFWSPIDLGSDDHSSWWPVSCFFLDPPNATEALGSILATTAVLWFFFMCLPLRGDTTNSD